MKRRNSRIALNEPAIDRLSVVIPAFERGDLLGKSLHALALNNLEGVEVVVVDDASTPELQKAVETPEALEVRWIRHGGNRGPAAARNTGLREARHPWILFLDADVMLPRQTVDWLRETLQLYRHRGDVAGVLGQYSEDVPGNGFFTDYKNLGVCYLYHTTDTLSPYLHTPIACIRKTLLVEAGGFDPRFATAEDFRLGAALGSQGHRFVIDRRIRGVHCKRYDLRSVLEEDRRRIRDLNRLNLPDEQKSFALRAHRPSRLLAAALPGPILLCLAFAILDDRLLLAALSLAIVFLLATFPLARYFWRRRGWAFALKAWGFLFFELLWAEWCMISSLLSGVGRRSGIA